LNYIIQLNNTIYLKIEFIIIKKNT